MHTHTGAQGDDIRSDAPMASESVWLKLVTVTSLVFTATLAISSYHGEASMRKEALSYCPENGCRGEPGDGEETWVSAVWEACHQHTHIEVCVYVWTMAYVYKHIFSISTLFLVSIIVPVVMYAYEETREWIAHTRSAAKLEAPVPDGPDLFV